MRSLALLMALWLVTTGCSESETPAGPPLKLTIAEISRPSASLIYIADAKGYLKDAGLDVTFKTYLLGRDALDGVLAGEADLATVFQTPVVVRLYEGQALGILASIFTSRRNTALVARADRGILSPTDLSGKRIGVIADTATEYFLSLLLATEGIPSRTVRLVTIDPADFEKPLLEGAVDGMVLFNPHYKRLSKSMGQNATLFHNDAFTDIAMLVGRRETVVAREETMVRLMKALAKAGDYVKNHREDSMRIVIARLAGKVDAAEIREAWDDFDFETRLDNILLANLRFEAQWYREHGKYTGAMPNFLDSIAALPLRAVKPALVTINTTDRR